MKIVDFLKFCEVRVHFDVVAEKILEKFNFLVFPSNVGSDAVRAFGIGNAELSLLSAPKSVLATAGRSFHAGWLRPYFRSFRVICGVG